jgi:hypothetical protein
MRKMGKEKRVDGFSFAFFNTKCLLFEREGVYDVFLRGMRVNVNSLHSL